MLNATAQKSYVWVWEERPEDLDPWRMNLSSSFLRFVGGQAQTNPSCPALAPIKAHSVSIVHLEKALLPAEAALSYWVLGWTQCWAEHNAGLHWKQHRVASRSGQAPAWSMGRRPLLSASACPNRSYSGHYLGLSSNPIWLAWFFQASLDFLWVEAKEAWPHTLLKNEVCVSRNYLLCCTWSWGLILRVGTRTMLCHMPWKPYSLRVSLQMHFVSL